MPKDKLIAALEKATGADRELDAAIFAVVYPDKVPSPIVESGYGWRKDPGFWWLQTGEDSRCPRQTVTPLPFTLSIDAALALLPAHHSLTLNIGPHGTHVARLDWPGGSVTAVSAVPALAIVIAALRATERGEAGR